MLILFLIIGAIIDAPTIYWAVWALMIVLRIVKAIEGE